MYSGTGTMALASEDASSINPRQPPYLPRTHKASVPRVSVALRVVGNGRGVEAASSVAIRAIAERVCGTTALAESDALSFARGAVFDENRWSHGSWVA